MNDLSDIDRKNIDILTNFSWVSMWNSHPQNEDQANDIDTPLDTLAGFTFMTMYIQRRANGLTPSEAFMSVFHYVYDSIKTNSFQAEN
jgi:hypothetical protein